ncbi:MAG TPA: DUF58 domain-containing protein [Bacteroidia bacterium]|jgi:uncharacterized protein (DUF58 family)|nr:DUF58 domain-containing protein [Bacteroidia bacterium]HQF29024.1 DUF58 domain-containing protein [Bacteroidia bacterium]HQK96884.1 DUF58 domain-containing protein [Bacteroidia bacterium]
MESSELLKKVRKIEIKTRGLSSQIFSGEYHSAFKGRGMAFSEVREYVEGDDVRNIDWNVTARFNHPYVKVFEEERELTVMMLVDVSASGNFGTNIQFKRDLITELTAVLAFSAIENNDKAGVIFFSDKIELFIPPKKGKTHILRIIRELINFQPTGTGTDIGGALRYLNNMIKKKSICFMISDFIGMGYEDALKVASKKHDLAALRIMDPREAEMPDVGLVRFVDAETGEVSLMDTSNANLRRDYNLWWKQTDRRVNELLNRSGVDHTLLRTDQPYVQPLLNLFKRRERRA